MSSVKFGVLGPVTVTAEGVNLDIGGPKQRTVLAMLVAHAREQVLASTLVHAAYGEEAEPNSKRRIQVYVSTLRGQLGDRIVKVGQGWKLDVPDEAIDAGRFEQMYRSARDIITENPEAAAELLREGLGLWVGHPYTGIDDHGMIDGEIRRLAELRLAALGARIDADLASGRHAELVGEIEALMADHPYTESLRAQHMLALYRAGRQREALRSFEEMRNVLVEELGVDPTKDLQDLEQKILDQDDSLEFRPGTTIKKKAILVVDAGDPLELARLLPDERQRLIQLTSGVLEGIPGGDAVGWIHSGHASFTSFDTTAAAARAAEDIHRRLDGQVARMAIDFGDVEAGDGVLTGAPMSRAAVLAAAAHPGQVVISSEAQQAFVADGEGRGLRFELLGSYRLLGLESEVPVYQLLVGDPSLKFPALSTDRLPSPVPGSGQRPLPGYELRDTLGTGSIGTLFKAYQASVGREVIVEVIPATVASQPDFVRRFEVDAQRLSLFDHPHVNSPIDYWRDTEGAYLVYRFHRGGFLDVGVAGPALVTQVGRALEYAHSYGVIHGSLRPDRIMLDESGNAYLFGFPLAGVLSDSSAEFAAYIAPEVLTGEPATAATDVYALGVLAAEIEEGPAAGDRALAPTDPVLARAVSGDPDDRYDTVGEFLDALSPQTGEPHSARLSELRNPYKGLAAFHESDAGDFYGRSELIAELTGHLADSNLLAVVGPSGVGKSSVVRAGLIPELRSGTIPDSEQWVITDMLPGPRPFLELERALERVAVDLPSSVRERFADRDPNALAGLRSVLPSGATLLVVVDQFEELFTMTDRTAAAEFLDLLVTAAAMNHARLIVTLRADFLGEPLLFSEFGDLLGANLITVSSPKPTEIAEAITGPAEGVGLAVDPGLVERMVADVHDRPGALPLLQYSLDQVFETRKSDQLTIDDYEAVGGVEGSLARRAETIFERLVDGQKAAIKQVLLRLVSVADDAAPTRRRVKLSDLDDLGGDAAVGLFVSARLLTTDRDADTRTPNIEVAHEALLEHWPRLADWIEQVTEDLALSRRLQEAIADWDANEQKEAYLLTGGRLAQHLEWTSSTALTLSPSELGFLTLSEENDRRSARRKRRTRIGVMAGFATAAVVALVFGLFARDSADTARARELAASAIATTETDPELSVLLASMALALDPSSATANNALNNAVQAHRTVFRVDSSPDLQPPIFMVGSMSPDGSMLVTNDGDMVRAYSVGDQAPLWTWSGYENHFFTKVYFDTGSEHVVVGLASHDDGCVSDRWDVLDASDGQILSDVRFSGLISYDGGPSQTGPFFDLDRPLILTVGGAPECSQNPAEAELIAVNLVTGSQEVIGFGATQQSFDGKPTLSADGSRLATAGDIGGAVIDLKTDEELLEIEPGHSVLSPDGGLVLASDNPLELWDIEDGRKLREFKADFSEVWFSESGSMVYGSTHDGRVLVFDTESGDLIHELRVRAAENLQMSADERWLATFSPGGARVWAIGGRIQGTAGGAEMAATHDGVYSFYRVGSTFVVGDEVLAVRGLFPNEGSITREFPITVGYEEVVVRDLESGGIIDSYDGFLVAASTDGALVAFQETGPPIDVADEGVVPDPPEGEYTPFGSIVIADARSGEPIQRMDGLCTWYQGAPFSGDFVETAGCTGYPEAWREIVLHASFSPDGELLAMAGATGRQAVWEVESGRLVWHRQADDEPLELHTFQSNVGFSPDGRFLAVSLTKDIEILDVADDFNVVAEFEVVRGGPFEILWTPDGSRLVLPDLSLTVNVFDTSNWERLFALVGHKGDFLPDAAIDPTGNFVASVGVDGELIVWDLSTGGEAQRISFNAGQFGLRNVEWVDEETLLVGSRDVAALVTLDPGTLIDNARESLTRSFTPEECATFDIDPCPTLEEIKSG